MLGDISYHKATLQSEALAEGKHSIPFHFHKFSRAHWLTLSSIRGQTHDFIIYVVRQRARVNNLTVCYRKKQMDVSFSCVCPVIDNEFRHNIVKVVCGSTRLSPRGSTVTLTM